ncbi:zinc metalloproteinase nas-8-like [Daphnia carinata]|uniref:zinc metalloproteinase nas-8-like n=1 Tax=Daphnia carinata TaxID=120202 RepID=UPI002580B075|nr:zinc metalloproteinase nas-8-like [Daphnia carinata]
MGRKNVLLTSSNRWPNAEIPYVISASYTSRQREIIASAIKAYHTHTCIRFVPRTVEDNYVRISKTGQGCWSDVGMVGGRQKVSLDDHCVLFSRPGLVMHELMHVLGFYHEHQRPDRDKYVSINFDNIERRNRDYFQKTKMWDLTTTRFSYDYGSLMHYPSDAFAKDPTIPVIKPLRGKPALGQRRAFSALDLKKLNRFYCKASGLYGFSGGKPIKRWGFRRPVHFYSKF